MVSFDLSKIRPAFEFLIEDPVRGIKNAPIFIDLLHCRSDFQALFSFTGLPCMTSAFAVLFLALLRATQIELVSPAFQTPRALTIFCFLHFGLSVSVDVTIGLYFNLRYMVLILQGVFIVWSLLLSAGYFYIFSALNK